MQRLLVALVLGVGLAAGASSAATAAPGAPVAPGGKSSITATRPPMGETVVFLRYKKEDMESATRFYENVLGLKKIYDNEKYGVKIFRINEHSAVCLDVENKEHPKEKGFSTDVRLAIHTEQVHEWYTWLVAHNAKFERPESTDDALTLSFEVKDPGGYNIEFYSFNR